MANSFFVAREKRLYRTTLEFYHPSFGYKRLIGGQQFDKTLTLENGQQAVFTAVNGELPLPKKASNGVLELKASFGAAGSEMRKLIKSYDSYQESTPSTSPIEVTYRTHIDDSVYESVTLYMSNTIVRGDEASVSATDQNLQTFSPSLIYRAAEGGEIYYPGLRVIS